VRFGEEEEAKEPSTILLLDPIGTNVADSLSSLLLFSSLSSAIALRCSELLSSVDLYRVAIVMRFFSVVSPRFFFSQFFFFCLLLLSDANGMYKLKNERVKNDIPNNGGSFFFSLSLSLIACARFSLYV